MNDETTNKLVRALTHEIQNLAAVPEILDRMKRVEIRTTNMMRSLGLLPIVEPPSAGEPVAVYEKGTVYVTNPHITLAEISRVAVLGVGSKGGTVEIVVLNHKWGEITIHGMQKEG